MPQGRPALCQMMESLGSVGLPCFIMEASGSRNRQNEEKNVVILLILLKTVCIACRMVVR